MEALWEIVAMSTTMIRIQKAFNWINTYLRLFSSVRMFHWKNNYVQLVICYSNIEMHFTALANIYIDINYKIDYKFNLFSRNWLFRFHFPAFSKCVNSIFPKQLHWFCWSIKNLNIIYSFNICFCFSFCRIECVEKGWKKKRIKHNY